MDKSLKSKPSQQRRQRRAFLPSAEGSGVSWTDKHKKKNLRKTADYINLPPCPFFTPLSSFAAWFPWMVNGQELESATGKYYRCIMC